MEELEYAAIGGEEKTLRFLWIFLWLVNLSTPTLPEMVGFFDSRLYFQGKQWVFISH